MLRPRIIPCLLIHNKGLVKTTKFLDPKYVGDPINAVRIFNEKLVDELIVFDIDATVEKRGPNFELIAKLAAECRMPFCYGGGVTKVEDVRKLVSLGVEKVAISNAAINNPEIIKKMVEEVGSQSIAIVLDVKKKLFGGYEVVTHNSKKGTGKNPVELASMFEKLEVGEIIVNSVDNDGVMKGYDFKLIEKVREVTTTPLSVVGGAGSLSDISDLISRFGIIGAVAGSLFVFKGVYKAVLINYPSPESKKSLYENSLGS
ncbi:MAG: AglZ/HisF2 family acetamidino modification protein [Bacteriovoracaceae bacterium]